MRAKTNAQPIVKSRRKFLKSSSALAAAAYLGRPASAQAQKETLALKGGPKAVTVSSEDAFTWPRFGVEEEQAMLEFLRKPNYWNENRAFDEEWKETEEKPIIDVARIVIPPKKRFFFSTDWRAKYVF